jgi:hypothetical protein
VIRPSVRDRPDIARLGRGFGISQATAYRYLNEAIEVLAARAPSLRQTLKAKIRKGWKNTPSSA